VTATVKVAQFTRGAVSLHRGGTYGALCLTCTTSKMVHFNAQVRTLWASATDYIWLRASSLFIRFLGRKRGLGRRTDRHTHARTFNNIWQPGGNRYVRLVQNAPRWLDNFFFFRICPEIWRRLFTFGKATIGKYFTKYLRNHCTELNAVFGVN